MPKKSFIVSLTGGLGNQLFQLAAALNLSSGKNLELTSAYGNPRPLNSQFADLYSFSLPTNVRIIERKPATLLVKKCVGYNLRMGIKLRNYEKIKFVKWLISKTTSFLLFFDLHKFVTLISSGGVGFSQINISKNNSLLVGYFQSFKWATSPEVFEKLKALNLLTYSEVLDKLYIESKEVLPLVVHVRLGDYLKEDSFGVLSKNYYLQAIEKMMATHEYKEIWVFSDDLENAKLVLPRKFEKLTKWMQEIENSPAKTLQAMRFGHGYVIGNSTFSWWGAFLSYNESAKVIAPDPWFKGMESPKDLIPPKWERIKSWPSNSY